jgi:hypothetical protein
MNCHTWNFVAVIMDIAGYHLVQINEFPSLTSKKLRNYGTVRAQ